MLKYNKNGNEIERRMQHYSPLIDAEVSKAWNVPDTWKLIAQMPFGKPTVTPEDKQVQPLEQRIKFFK